jgi:hypothetical protein
LRPPGYACAGATLVVDGAAWMYRAPLVPRQMVSQASKGVEAKSRVLTGHAAGSGKRAMSKL